MMITKLGVISGEILTMLEAQGPMTVKEFEIALREKKDVILMCIGSLIRLGLIEAEYTSGSTFYRQIKTS